MIRKEENYNCVSVWGIPFADLASIPNSTWIGPSVDGSFGMIPAGISLDELYSVLQALEATIGERRNDTSGIEGVSNNRQSLTAIYSDPPTESRVSNTVSNTVERAQAAKAVKDVQRRNEQITQMRAILADSPTIGASELARLMGVSRQTVYNLKSDLSGQLFIGREIVVSENATGDDTPPDNDNIGDNTR